jgi:hypothetical protein
MDCTTKLPPGKRFTQTVIFDGNKLKIEINSKEDASTPAQVKGGSSQDDAFFE